MDVDDNQRFAKFRAFAEKLSLVPQARPQADLTVGLLLRALIDDFPAPGIRALDIYREVREQRERDYSGKNRVLERVLADLARLGVSREEVLDRSDVPLALYRHVVTLSHELDLQRPAVMRLRRSYADLLRQLKRDRYMRPPTRRAAMDDVELILRYLAEFPTGEQARVWRRRNGIDKDGNLDRLRVWTATATKTAEYLARAFKNYERDNFLPPGVNAVSCVARILCARYPTVFPSLSRERLRRRIGW